MFNQIPERKRFLKDIATIEKELNDLYLSNKSAKGLPYYKMQTSGDILMDFVKFTDLQCLKPSSDPNDWYIKNGGHWCPKADKNGNKIHTKRDITWNLFHSFCPSFLPEQFIEMSDETKIFIVRNVIKSAIITNSDAVNYLLGYCIWGTGNCQKELALYKEWYESKLQKDIDALGDRTVFIRLADIRKFRMSSSSFPGHLGGILCFYNVFKNYLINKI